MEKPEKEKQESILSLGRDEALRHDLTIDLSIPNTKTSRTCMKYFGPSALVSISHKAMAVLKEAMDDSAGLLKLDVLVLGLCIAAKHWAIGKNNPVTAINKVDDYLFPLNVSTKRLGAFEFIFRCATTYEDNYRKKVVTLLHVGDR